MMSAQVKGTNMHQHWVLPGGCRFPGNLTFGIAEALSSAAPDQSSLVPSKAKVQQWRPVWQETLNGEDSSLYTIRMTHGKRNVIKRPVYSVERYARLSSAHLFG